MHLQVFQKVKFKVDPSIGGWSGIAAIVVEINREREVVWFQKGTEPRIGGSRGLLSFRELGTFLSNYNISLENK